MFYYYVSAVIIAGLLLQPQLGQKRQMKNLRQQVERFYTLYSSPKQDDMWKILSSRLKQENDNNKQKYISNLPKPGAFRPEASIEEIRIAGNMAKVRVKITIVSDTDKKIGFEDHEDSWVLERGRWRFDGYTVIQYKVFDK
jgi:hypothetical protein